MTYTCLSIDTGAYETRQDPYLNSVRQFRIEAISAGEAQLKAQVFLLEEFGDADYYNWRVFVTEGTQMFVSEGNLLPIINKVPEN